MKDIPIIFSAPMIRALLEGRKTQTRRLAGGWRKVHDPVKKGNWLTAFRPTSWQRVRPGDRLWVRERWCDPEDDQSPVFWADLSPGEQIEHDAVMCLPGIRKSPAYRPWRPSIHMPRWASRLTLIVTATKIERLQEISREDAIAEGLKLVSQEIEQFFRWPEPFDAGMWLSPPAAYGWLWRELHSADSWNANPEVVALSFTVHKMNIDAMPEEKAA